MATTTRKNNPGIIMTPHLRLPTSALLRCSQQTKETNVETNVAKSLPDPEKQISYLEENSMKHKGRVKIQNLIPAQSWTYLDLLGTAVCRHKYVGGMAEISQIGESDSDSGKPSDRKKF